MNKEEMKISNSQIIIYQTSDGKTQLDVKLDNETVWLSQTQLIDLFQSTKQNISLHINNVFKEGELDKKATVKEYLTVRQEGNRSVKRNIEHYNLDVIISVGYRVKSQRGTQFRIWANSVLKNGTPIPPTTPKIPVPTDKVNAVRNKITQANLPTPALKWVLVQILDNFPETADLINENLG